MIVAREQFFRSPLWLRSVIESEHSDRPMQIVDLSVWQLSLIGNLLGVRKQLRACSE